MKNITRYLKAHIGFVHLFWKAKGIYHWLSRHRLCWSQGVQKSISRYVFIIIEEKSLGSPSFKSLCIAKICSCHESVRIVYYRGKICGWHNYMQGNNMDFTCSERPLRYSVNYSSLKQSKWYHASTKSYLSCDDKAHIGEVSLQRCAWEQDHWACLSA